jgi:hypothetical protein
MVGMAFLILICLQVPPLDDGTHGPAERYVHMWLQPVHSHDLTSPENSKRLSLDPLVRTTIETMLLEHMSTHQVLTQLRVRLAELFSSLRPDQLATRRFSPTPKDMHNIAVALRSQGRLSLGAASAPVHVLPPLPFRVESVGLVEGAEEHALQRVEFPVFEDPGLLASAAKRCKVGADAAFE